MGYIKHDLHLHLYGAPTSKQIWEVGKERYRGLDERLQWYAQEYALAAGHRPEYRAYWESDNGYELMCRDLELTMASDFREFQARFNLMIALLPLEPKGTEVLSLVGSRLQSESVKYAELRVPLLSRPPVSRDTRPLTRSRLTAVVS